MDIRALTHEPLPGVRVACRMEGDAFEMEDQRNWMDASYKTYVRPLALPWPYTIAKGEKLAQRVSLSVTGTPGQARRRRRGMPPSPSRSTTVRWRGCRPWAWPSRPTMPRRRSV